MTTGDSPYEITAHNGLEVNLSDPTHTFVMKINGKDTLAGDILQLAPVVGQTGKTLAILDTSGATVFSIDKDGAAVFTGAITPTGGITGVNVVTPTAAVTADGAITIAAANKAYFVTKAGVAAMTIADPTPTTHDGVTLDFIAATANAHTLSNAAGSGFFSSGGSSKDVATFGGAIGDRISIIAYQGKWYIKDSLNITLG